MQRCLRCNVKIRGKKRCCPLCGGALKIEDEKNPEAAENVFPVIKKKKLNKFLVVRIAAFIAIVFVVWMRLIEYAAGHELSWTSIVNVASLLAFLDVCILMYYRSNVLKTITWQIYVLMWISVLVDYYTNWYGWSVSFVIPLLFLLLVLITVAVGFFLKMRLTDFVLYLLWDMLLSLIQLLLIRLDINTFPLPAMISIVSIGTLLLAILLFRWRDFSSATTKYFNV